MKRILSFLMVLATVLTLCSCGSSETGSTDNSKKKIVLPDATQATSRTADEVGFQLNAPSVGEKVVVLETSMGKIVIRMFPESAPKAVENFMTHADNGYYNGLIFHRVINDFMIQGGDPEGTGRGGESIWEESFEDEFNANLLNIRGSLAMANSGADTNGSQFFINQKKTFSRAENTFDISEYFDQMIANEENISYLTDMYKNDATLKQEYSTVEEFISVFIYEYIADNMFDHRKVPEKVWEFYEKYGGNISLDGAWKVNRGHTVFGQVVIGMDIVDKIVNVDTDEDDKPLTDVVIKKAYTTEFTEKMLSELDSYIVK